MSEPNESPELPDVHMAVLDRDTLLQLFRDLAASQVIEVRVKGHPSRHSSDEAWQLEPAREAFMAEQLPGLQVRYTWKGAVWCDTLMRTAEGTRLVRMQQPDFADGAPP